MQWFGKAVGGLIGALAGPWGALAGMFLGHQVDLQAEARTRRPSVHAISQLFFEVAFEIMGRVAKVDGRVSEDEKIALLRQALALIHPSPFESLALVLLEAFWCATPALVYGRNDVLVQHCRASNGGLWYRDYAELAVALAWFEAHPAEARELGAQGLEYVRREYSLPAYEERLAALYP